MTTEQTTPRPTIYFETIQPGMKVFHVQKNIYSTVVKVYAEVTFRSSGEVSISNHVEFEDGYSVLLETFVIWISSGRCEVVK